MPSWIRHCLRGCAAWRGRGAVKTWAWCSAQDQHSRLRGAACEGWRGALPAKRANPVGRAAGEMHEPDELGALNQ
jgi:hypothetical protein